MRISRSTFVTVTGLLLLACSDNGVTPGDGGDEVGSIEGQVLAPSIEGEPTPLPGANVMVYRATCELGALCVTTANATTDSTGHYVLHDLPPTSYVAVVTPPSGMALEGQEMHVEVKAGQTLTLSFSVSRVSSSDSTHTDSTGVTKPVVMVAITPHPLTLNVSDSAGVYASLKAADSSVVTGRAVTWTVSDASVIKLDAFGQSALLRALKSGSVTLTATSEGRTGYSTVTVR